jgi:hypothetical protein
MYLQCTVTDFRMSFEKWTVSIQQSCMQYTCNLAQSYIIAHISGRINSESVRVKPRLLYSQCGGLSPEWLGVYAFWDVGTCFSMNWSPCVVICHRHNITSASGQIWYYFPPSSPNCSTDKGADKYAYVNLSNLVSPHVSPKASVQNHKILRWQLQSPNAMSMVCERGWGGQEADSDWSVRYPRPFWNGIRTS